MSARSPGGIAGKSASFRSSVLGFLGLSFGLANGCWIDVFASDETVLAVQPDELDRLWLPVRHDRPQVPFMRSFERNLPCTQIDSGVEIPWQRGSRPGFCGLCVSVGYVIEPSGRTSSHRLLRVVPDIPQRRAEDLFSYVFQAMHKWQFEPTQENGKRDAAYTYFNYSLVVQDEISEAEREGAWDTLERLCDIARFP